MATSANQFSLTVKKYPIVEGRVSILKSPPHGEEKVVITILFLLESYKETMKNLTDGNSKCSSRNYITLNQQKFSFITILLSLLLYEEPFLIVPSDTSFSSVSKTLKETPLSSLKTIWRKNLEK